MDLLDRSRHREHAHAIIRQIDSGGHLQGPPIATLHIGFIKVALTQRQFWRGKLREIKRERSEAGEI
jgi:hypothetical protein